MGSHLQSGVGAERKKEEKRREATVVGTGIWAAPKTPWLSILMEGHIVEGQEWLSSEENNIYRDKALLGADQQLKRSWLLALFSV